MIENKINIVVCQNNLPPKNLQPFFYLKHYDYIFIGAGCAGLSLLTRMIASGLAAGKRILLIDRSPKNENDRTWCFWEDKPGFFEPVIYKQWDRLWFHSPSFSKQFAIAPYQYKMIRGIDFYNHCLGVIQKQQNIDFIRGEITNCYISAGSIKAIIGGEGYVFSRGIIFNSIWKEEVLRQQDPIYLLQHFKGWIIETPYPFFKPAEATLMDFRTGQEDGATFAYVLPLSETKALVEYTLFSEKILPDKNYNDGLRGYLNNCLQLKDYTIVAEEFGVIPMTDAKFPWFHKGMYHIGTAGGQTKASSGYTFQFIQKQSEAIVQQIKKDTLWPEFKPEMWPKRFNFYDAVLLRVLANKHATGKDVFTQLFKKNKPQNIFSFLDNETTFMQDIKIIASLPTWPFLKAAVKNIFNVS